MSFRWFFLFRLKTSILLSSALCPHQASLSSGLPRWRRFGEIWPRKCRRGQREMRGRLVWRWIAEGVKGGRILLGNRNSIISLALTAHFHFTSLSLHFHPSSRTWRIGGIVCVIWRKRVERSWKTLKRATLITPTPTKPNHGSERRCHSPKMTTMAKTRLPPDPYSIGTPKNATPIALYRSTQWAIVKLIPNS